MILKFYSFAYVPDITLRDGSFSQRNTIRLDIIESHSADTVFIIFLAESITRKVVQGTYPS